MSILLNSALARCRNPLLLLFVGSSMSIALLIGEVFGLFGLYAWFVVLGTLYMCLLLLFQQYEVAVTTILAVHLYADWYWGFGEIALALMIALVCILFLVRSSKGLWRGPDNLALWSILLVFSLLPMLKGITFLDGLYYYSNVIISAYFWFWLGKVIAYDMRHLERLVKMLAFFGTLVALHAIIQFGTGNFLLASNRYDAYLLLDVGNFPLYGSHRVGSFLVNPDTAGTFFACLLFLPLSLLFSKTSWVGKILYALQVFVMLLALLFTYSSGGWVAAFAGLSVFLFLVGNARSSMQILLFSGVAAITILVLFPGQVSIQLQHATAPNELSLRTAAWQTGIEVIKAFPLTGIGLGRYGYIVRADPYRVPGQYIPLYHPHNSYLEVAALGGVPIAILLYTLLALAICRVVRAWMNVHASHRALIGGGLASTVALSINSLSSPCWTLPPLLAIGWLLLGSMGSPFSTQYKRKMYTPV